MRGRGCQWRNGNGFTLIELLLVIALIAILAAATVVAIDPGQRLGDARNNERESDINAVLNAVYQYTIDNNGTLPASLTTTPTEICATGAGSCVGLIDLSVLTNSEAYLVALPQDPNGTCAANGVCYEISETVNGRVTVTAPDAENGDTITITR